MFVNEGEGRYKCKVKAAFKFKYDGIGMVDGCPERPEEDVDYYSDG